MNFCPRVRDAGAALLCAALLVGAAPVDQSLPLQGFSLGSVVIGASVLKAVERFGPPDFVQTTDLGHEWQWIEAGGMDHEVLADDDMIVHQVLVARPAPIPGQSPAPLVQPAEFAALGVSVDDATTSIESAGGDAVAEPDPAVRAWAVSGGVVVAELQNGVVGQLLALDDNFARRLGYLQPPPPVRTPVIYHAPQIIKEFDAPYPDAAFRANAGGRAVVRVLINAAGAPQDPRIVVSSGNDAIDAVALENVRKSTYRAARCDDAPCSGVYFDLQDYWLTQ